MTANKVYAYWEAITAIESQELLLQLRVADWPSMKKKDRASFHRRMHRMAYPKTDSDRTKPISTKELHEKLRMITGG